MHLSRKRFRQVTAVRILAPTTTTTTPWRTALVPDQEHYRMTVGLLSIQAGFAVENPTCYCASVVPGEVLPLVTVGDEIRRRRTDQGLSLNDLARLSHVAKGYLSQLENNQAPRPSATTLYKIA